MPKMIAFRKTTRVDDSHLVQASTTTKRQRLDSYASHSDRVDKFEDAGIHQFRLNERIPPQESGFQRLGLVGAYVVDVPTDREDAAKEILGDSYQVMPDIAIRFET